MAPLQDVVVVELASALAGPHAAMMLGDLGARVIKVEPPQGDVSRSWGPPFVGEGAARVSTYFLSCNRNKESVVADLDDDADCAMVQALVGRADVLVHSWPVQRLSRFGLGYRDLARRNPALVVLEITGFGPDGPDQGRPGYDQIAQGEAGLMSLTGEPGHPTRVGVPISDLLAGMNGAYGVLAALHDRERSGRGTVVHSSLLAAAVGVHAFQGTRVTVAGETPEAVGDHHPTIAPYGVFRAADGPLQIAVGTQRQWRALAEVLGLDPDEERFTTNEARVAHRSELTAILDQRLARRSIQPWLDDLRLAQVPAGRVSRLDEVYDSAQVRAQGLLRSVEHSALGTLQLPGVPLRMSALDAGLDREIPMAPASAVAEESIRFRPPPVLGEHTESVRRWAAEQDVRAQ